MQLFYSKTSPFVRKVLIAAIELGLRERIELVETDAWSPETALPQTNPLGKVPALDTDDGLTLVDSKLIVDYLDDLAGGGKIIPSAGRARYQQLADAMIADGVLEASLLQVIEKLRRPEEYRWEGWIERQRDKIETAMAHLEKRAEDGVLDGAVDMLQITLACACAYIDFRLPEIDWRSTCPKIAAWYETFSERQSMTSTKPN